MAIAIKVMKPGKAAESSEVCGGMISVSGEVGVNGMVELCQRVLDGKGVSDEWQTSMLVLIFKEKGDVRNCNTYRGVESLEHAMKVVERVLEKKNRELVNIDSMRFGFMPEEEQQTHCLLHKECKRNIGIRRKSCTCVLWILRRHLIEFQEK